MHDQILNELSKPHEWKKRRLRLDIAMLICVAVIAIYIVHSIVLVTNHAGLLAMAQTASVTGSGLVMAYVFGSIADDRYNRNTFQNYASQYTQYNPPSSRPVTTNPTPPGVGAWKT